jgi:hypothetical protein
VTSALQEREEQIIMKHSRIVTTTLCAAILVTLAAPAAHAGGGMGAGSGVSTCRTISQGVNPPHTISITDTLTVGDEVRVGRATLLCDLPASGLTVAPAGATTTPVTDPNAIVCYTLVGADRTSVAASITDVFGTQDVGVGTIQLLCVPARL